MSIILNKNFVNKSGVIKLLSIDGKLIFKKKINFMSQIENINIHQFANGKYLLQIISDTEVEIKNVQIVN